MPCECDGDVGAASLLAAAVRPRRRARAGWELQAGDASAKPVVRRRTGTGTADGGFDVVAQRSAGVRVRAVERAAGVAQVGASFCCVALWAATEEEAGKRSWLLHARRCNAMHWHALSLVPEQLVASFQLQLQPDMFCA